MPRACGLLALGLVAVTALRAPDAAADSSLTPERSVTRLADGVYEIRHADPLPGWVNGNTLVVIGSQSVLVVDACNVAWEAKADITQIRQWTRLPVRYLVNTHWHHDHNAGNRSYLDAFPRLAIVATSETRRRLDANAPYLSAQILKSAAQTRATYEKMLATGKNEGGQPISDAAKARAKTTLARVGEVERDARTWVNQSPTLTFDDSISIDLGHRVVKIQFLGRGNTGGDAIVWLPAERIVSTGDLVVHPVPYTFDGYPSEWVRTLERLMALDAGTIVPGHGDVMRDDRYVHQLHDLMQSIVQQIGLALDRDPDAGLDDVKKGVDVTSRRDAILAGDTADAGFFDYAVAAFEELAYHEAKAR